MIDRRGFMGAAALGGAISFATSGQAASNTSAQSGSAQFELWHTELGSLRDSGSRYGYTTRPADIGYITVPAVRSGSRASVQNYRLRFARLRGPKGAAAPPVFFFNGGPAHWEDLWWLYDGGLGTNATFAVIDTILKHTDLVLIDHRGTAGCVFPKIPNNNITAQLPLDRPVDPQMRRAACKTLWDRVIAHQLEAGVDLSTINTTELASDVDAIREALGYSKIRLMGVSNGTYRSRAYMRNYREHVDSALLFVSHAYEKQPNPSDVRESVKRFDQVAAADPIVGRYVPSTIELMGELTHRLNQAPQKVAIPSPDDPHRTVVVSGDDLPLYFWAAFSANRELMKWPGRLWKLKQGDYSELAQIALHGRTLQGNQSDAAYAGMAMPTPAVEAAYSAAAGDQRFLNRDTAEMFADSCPLPRDLKTPFEQSVPVTYVLGDWDVHTPVEAVERMAGEHARIIVNANQGHEGTLSNDVAYPQVCFEQGFVEAFLTRKEQKSYTHPLAFDRSAFPA
jgi:pimeloyl-ACP methyl ester carboxylesterase